MERVIAAPRRTRALITPARLRAALGGIGVAQFAAWIWFALPRFGPEPFGTDDFSAYWAIAHFLGQGRGDLSYDLDAVAGLQAFLGLPMTIPLLYPPFFLVIALPFTFLQPGPAYMAWGIFNLGLLGISVYLLARTFVPSGDRMTYALLVLSSLQAGRNLYLGQTASFLVLGVAVATIGITARKDRWVGLGSAALLIKPQLLPIWLATLLWYRRFRALLVLGAATLGLCLVSYALVGQEGIASYFGLLTRAGLADKVGFQATGSHTLAGLAHGIDDEISSRVAYLTSAVAISGYYLWSLFRARSTFRVNSDAVVSLAVVTTLLVSPHSFIYDLILWAVPLALRWSRLVAGGGRFLIALAYIAPWVSILREPVGAGFVFPTVLVSVAAFVLLTRELTQDPAGFVPRVRSGPQ